MPDHKAVGEGGQSSDSSDVLAEARRARIEIMRGEGGRNAMARLKAANDILGMDQLCNLTDEQLEAEIMRIAAEIKRRSAK